MKLSTALRRAAEFSLLRDHDGVDDAVAFFPGYFNLVDEYWKPADGTAYGLGPDACHWFLLLAEIAEGEGR